MEQTELGPFAKSTKFDQFSRDELIERNRVLESELARAVKEVYRLKYQHLSEEQLNMVLQEHLAELNAAVYGASSERYKKPVDKPKKEGPSKPRVKLPSERSPMFQSKRFRSLLTHHLAVGVAVSRCQTLG
jgi:hypothetical protein